MTQVYLKAPPQDPQQFIRKQQLTTGWLRFKMLLPTIMITVGASLLISVGYPILAYELKTGSREKRERIVSPVSESVLAEGKGLLNPSVGERPIEPQVLAQSPGGSNQAADYSQINTWFNFSRPQSPLTPSTITHYNLSIPKLRIKDALVTIGGDDLDKSLIHYGGTANPGEPGSPVIFGHSILPQFYSPNSYRAIFSLLPSLKTGDEILVSFDGITYKYVVYDYYEVLPEEIDILEQQYNRKDLTLVTCVPPGTYWRRGIIKARLVEI
ncbi:MAG: sortase [Patescibacteria group bacterium]|nr:sortase [Candidatus Beckwithbacteria bacterium]MDZ4229077.1 sortase [Patescibacteria group bacterium]